MASKGRLRVIDFASTSALRSQTLWHALATGVSEGNPPTLSFVRPNSPYVSIGYHRRLEEIDITHCETRGLAVYRRMVGGGPVYLDSNQLFFQVTVPMSMVPPIRSDALVKLLAPAASAFQAAGLDAQMDASHEIVVGDRKVCGHGAGQIEDAAVVVGNCIEQFDHVAATSILALPDEEFRAEVLSCMRRFVGVNDATVDAQAFQETAVEAFAEAFDLDPQLGELDSTERRRLDEWDELMVKPDWARGPMIGAKPRAHQVKIRSGVYVIRVSEQQASATLTVINGRLKGARFVDPMLLGSTSSLEEGVVGLTLLDAQAKLNDAGSTGKLLADAIGTIDHSALEAGR